jgi:anti-sigma factor RsiW
MNHQPFEEWLLTEKPLDPKERLELDSHLRICSHCIALAETGKALRTVKRVSPAAGFAARFQNRLALQRAADRRRRAWGSVVFTLGGLVMLMWLMGPYLATFLASPATWIAAVMEWGIFLVTTLYAMAEASSVVMDVVPGFLPPFAWMVLLSAVAGVSLLWFVSIWRLTQRGVPRGV